MPSTPSPNLRIQLIASGEQANTWGTTTNTNLGTLIEQSICGMATLNLTGATYTLTVYNYVQDESRMMLLNCQGSPGTTCTITAPSVSKMYVVANQTADDSDIEIWVGSGTPVTIPPGVAATVWTDGIDFFYANDISVYITGVNGAAVLPVGTTSQRPSPPQAGEIRLNSTTTKFEGYNGIAWGSIGGGATGGGSDQVFVENGQTVTTSYTISTGFNAESVGPISIDAGVTVTVPVDQYWVIL
jgi:hypothetical protein